MLSEELRHRLSKKSLYISEFVDGFTIRVDELTKSNACESYQLVRVTGMTKGRSLNVEYYNHFASILTEEQRECIESVVSELRRL